MDYGRSRPSWWVLFGYCLTLRPSSKVRVQGKDKVIYEKEGNTAASSTSWTAASFVKECGKHTFSEVTCVSSCPIHEGDSTKDKHFIEVLCLESSVNLHASCWILFKMSNSSTVAELMGVLCGGRSSGTDSRTFSSDILFDTFGKTGKVCHARRSSAEMASVSSAKRSPSSGRTILCSRRQGHRSTARMSAERFAHERECLRTVEH